MLLHLGTIFFSLLLNVLPAIAHAGSNDASLDEGGVFIPNVIEPVYNSNILSKRQNNNYFNCTAQCTLTDGVYGGASDVCIDIEHGATDDPNRRGASLTMIRSTVTAGRNININLVDRNQNGLVVLWLEDVTLTANGTVNLNLGDNGCLADDCEVIVYMRNVTVRSGATGQTTTVGDAIYSSRLDKGK
ncbi:hypothetical protein IFM53868_06541 [Aspergillus udagawae]|uniref:Uncharacterized protein n=1 Tax=Aspergillus udagawae TaxID=91492 RepID=A0ABQ1B0M4_9EURO|nr:hypothetical protein IFM53868_06541 [Aspergillus udagawae]